MIKPNAILEVNLKNLEYNYKKLSKIANNSACAAVIKADAYGTGVLKIFETLYKNNCRHFFVATTEEALEIRNNIFNDKSILEGSVPITTRPKKKESLLKKLF